MVQRGAGLQRFQAIRVPKNPFKHWEKPLSCTQNHNLSFLFYVIINVIYSLDEKSREKVAAKQKIFS